MPSLVFGVPRSIEESLERPPQRPREHATTPRRPSTVDFVCASCRRVWRLSFALSFEDEKRRPSMTAANARREKIAITIRKQTSSKKDEALKKRKEIFRTVGSESSVDDGKKKIKVTEAHSFFFALPLFLSSFSRPCLRALPCVSACSSSGIALRYESCGNSTA